MVRFFLTTAFALALAIPALSQQPARPRENDDVAKLREQVRELEAKLKQSAPKKEEKGEKKSEQKDENKGEKKPEPKGPPMGGAGDWQFGGGGFGGGSGGGGFGGGPGGGGFGGGPGGQSPGGSAWMGGMGGPATMSGGRGGMDFTRMPGFEKLSPDEQKMLTKLVEKMRTPTPPAGSGASSNSVEARLDRLEKAIGELTNSMRRLGGGGGEGGSRGPGGSR